MARFQVPQFIEQKARLFGFLTLQQFLYVVGVGIISLTSYYVFNFFFWVAITLVSGGVAALMGFVKIEGREFPEFVRSVFRFFWDPQIYVWKRIEAKETFEISESKSVDSLRAQAGFQNKLKDLINGIATRKQPRAGVPLKTQKEKYQTITFLTGEKKKARRIDY